MNTLLYKFLFAQIWRNHEVFLDKKLFFFAFN
jgi:hypothetical protein